MFEKYIGDKKFYKTILAVAVPILIQNSITNFVNLLDNVMVGKIGTEQMSGVSIVNQLVFVFNLCVFGAFSGAGIFTAQYYGMNNDNGIRQTCRFKLLEGIVISIGFCLLLHFKGDELISMYLNDGSDGNLERTLLYGMDYLKIAIWGLPFFMLVQVFSTTLRECGQTFVPMVAGLVAIAINLLFNWLLIFGVLGFPCLGVRGAAIATLMSRIAEVFIVAGWSFLHKKDYPFMDNLFSSLKVESSIAKKILIIGSPLLLNELLWSSGQALLIQCYSMRGLESVAGFNIATTLINVFKTVLLALGNTVGIIVGRTLGAGDMEEAVVVDRKITAFSVFITIFVGILMALVSPLYPLIYNTTEVAMQIAAHAIIVASLFMPLDAFKNATYFTLRSGGRTWITFLFDGAFVWLVSVPIAFSLSRFTNIASENMFFLVYLGDLIKVVLGFILVRKRVWLRNIVG